MTRILTIDDKAKAKANALMCYARQHIYYPGPNASTPGDDRHFVIHLNTYRCVFTYTKEPTPNGRLYRHLSISVPSEDYPNPVAASEIAGLFGFSKPEEGLDARLKAGAWLSTINKEEHCIVLAEELKEDHVDDPA